MSIGHVSGKFLQRSPKSLSKQAGDRFALEVLKQSIEPITKGLNKDYDDPVILPEIIEHLKSIKNWYWGEASEWLGYGCTKLRCMISKSFMDLLDVRKRFRKCKILQRYIIQMLFCCEVGNFERPHKMDIEKSVCDKVTKLINQLGHFHFEKLYDTYLKFKSGEVLTKLLHQSPELKMIHLRHSISPSRLCFLPLNACRNLEVVTIDVENVYNESFDTLGEHLFKTFSGNEGRGILDSTYRPFPHLKAVCIRYDRFPEQLIHILHLLQLHLNIITQQTCLISLPFNTVQEKCPFVCPTMVIGKDTNFKSIQVYLRTPVSGSSITRLENSSDSASNISSFSLNFTSSVQNLQNTVGSLQSLGLLRYIYFDQRIAVVTTAEGVTGEDLAELHVFGKLETREEVHNLVKVLNSYPTLQVLCFQLEITIEPGIRLLNLMKHLRSLSISLKMFEPTKSHSMENLPPESNSISFIMAIIRAAPNIEVLEIPGRSNLLTELQPDLISQVETLILIDGDVEGGRCFIKNLPSLSVLVMSTDHNQKYLKIKKAFKCTQLEVISRNTRAVFPVIL